MPQISHFHNTCYVTGECPLGWESYGSSCYMVTPKEVTYNEAESTCHQMNSILTSVTSQQEQDYLTGEFVDLLGVQKSVFRVLKKVLTI